ncbi:type II toxin-antitoxin system RatA family toxin [Psittacicella gerlachiana]|uniref:Coenzyme Q-binding protein COQ10 START domain-containing protein n=1 Tax=Psittacicella gerlachiana TaxID=2028574 RepID=A0A3A1Y2E1_9GAMM|nr:type II toxin-antitoxin system RatA family toxin [Psittacicella gerlachiana]RIY31469.1 hypothetical protein CKF59_07625 [Psittacicella gerlachiana]
MIIEHAIDVDYTCEQMFQLVANYLEYPEFIKNCVSAKTFSQKENEVLAELEMSFAGISQKFSTYTKFYPFEKITMDLAEGPFEKLKGYWSFEPLESNAHHTRVYLYMDYKMNSFIEFLVGSKFKAAMVNMVDSFIQRAREKYS